MCATAENAKCKRYFSPTEDGLRQEWKGICWMNPPYGREIDKWMKNAFESALVGQQGSVAELVLLYQGHYNLKFE